MERAGAAKEERLQNQRAADENLFDAQPMHLPVFMKALAERCQNAGRKLAVFDEALTHSPEVTRYLRFEEPGTYFQTRAGMLGTGLPGTIGLKVAQPNALVIGFVGDGASMQTIQTLATAARDKIGAKFVVCNNRSYRILKYNLQQYWSELREPRTQTFPPSFDLVPPFLDFVKLAEGQGVKGARVEHRDQIQGALDQFLADPDEPFLLDVVISSEL
jgi:thiamine pyrophosphate-dependent acetolactate synthase large subunit-like protein